MLHCFRALGVNIALDVLSGSVHVLDDMAFEALTALEAGNDPRPALLAKYPADEVDGLLSEIETLRAQGAILSEHDYSNLDIGKPGIVKAMCLHAAHDCNLRCRYCFASTGDFHGERSLLPLETGKKALDWLVAHSGNRHQLEVDFFGGEPLMNYDVVHDLVLYARELEKKHDKRFQLTITTNCLGLTDERIEFLNREMHNIVLSIDGRREVHDYMRPMVNGKGSFDEAVKRAKKLVNLRGDGQYYVRGTYTARNLDFGNDVLALADEGFEQLSIEPVVLEESSPFALTKEMLPEILAEYDRFARVYLERRKNGPWMNFFHFMVDLDGGPCVKKRVKGCGAGNEYVAVTPEGDIYPCHQFVGRPGYKMGSVLTGEFDTEMQKRFAANTVLSKEKCGTCWARFFCGGGCAANAEAFNGDIAKPYDMECELERKRLECALAICAIEKLGAQADEEKTV